MKNKPISDQVALVTGGGTGIGRAFTEALATAGARVVIASRREDVLRHAAEEINLKLSAEKVFPYVFDIRERHTIDALVGHVVEQHGALDLLVNNSGLAVPETADIITEEGWDKVIYQLARSDATGAGDIAAHDCQRVWRHRQHLFASWQARLCGRAVLLRFEVRFARICRGVARSRA